MTSPLVASAGFNGLPRHGVLDLEHFRPAGLGAFWETRIPVEDESHRWRRRITIRDLDHYDISGVHNLARSATYNLDVQIQPISVSSNRSSV
jgi:hypothetical protein